MNTQWIRTQGRNLTALMAGRAKGRGSHSLNIHVCLGIWSTHWTVKWNNYIFIIYKLLVPFYCSIGWPFPRHPCCVLTLVIVWCMLTGLNAGRLLSCVQCRRQKFSFWGGCVPWFLGTVRQWVPRTKPLSLRGEAEAVCRHCLQILTAETIKIWKFPHKFTPDSWPVCFMVGVRRHSAGMRAF